MKRILALGCLAVALVLGTVASSAAVDRVPSFAAPKWYAVPYASGCGRCADSLAVGDLNGDGRPDVVTVNDADTISVFIAKPGGGLGARSDYLTAGDPAGAAIADLNGDRHADVAVADSDGFITVFLNRGDGTFGARRDYAPGNNDPLSIAIGDLNGDGAPDLVTANPEEGTISVLLNSGDGTFSTAHDYPTGARGDEGSVAIGDLNGDGKPDVVTGDGEDGLEPGFVSVLLNRGDGTFQTARDYDAEGANSVVLGDLNGDGKLDVAAAGAAYGGVAVFLNTGDGTLQRRRVYPWLGTPDQNPDPQSIAIADLNGDGRPDLVTANFDRHVSLLLNDGTGAFHRSIDVGTGKCEAVFENDRGLATGDLNGAGRTDLAVAADGGLCVSIAKPGLCNVQEVRGLKLAAARMLLVRAHCRVGAIRYARSLLFNRGKVSAERPGFGRALRSGAKVDLVVSLGRR